jgi:hypothetical protein
MIELIRLILPYLLVLFFVAKGIKEPLYFLGIPFLMFMSNSIFFEGANLFHIPGSLDYALMLIWVIILWILSKRIHLNKEKNVSHRFNPLDYCIIGLILITIAGLLMTINDYSNITDANQEFITLISLFAGYFIIKNWSSHNKPEVWVDFLYCLVIINTIASFFFILHQGLHISIYQEEEHVEELFKGVEITRSFYFMPQFLSFSIVFILVFKDKKSFYPSIFLIINLLAIFITYTRSSVIDAAVIFLLYFILIGIKNGRLGLVFKNIFIYSLLCIIGFIMISKFLPANTEYFMDRFNELSKSSSVDEPNSLEYRFLMTGTIISQIDADNKMLGMGSVTEKQLPLVTDMERTTSDMVWTGVIFRWGIVGLILFILLYFYSIIRAFNFFMKSDGILSDLGLFFLLYIISQIIESFFSWTFMSGHGFTIGLWYFAMLSTLIGFKEYKGLSNNKAISLTD